MEKTAKEIATRPRNRAPVGDEARAAWLRSNPIRKARMAAGLTQRALASEAKTSDVTVRTIEQGATRTSAVLERIAAVLGVPELAASYLRWLRRCPRPER